MNENALIFAVSDNIIEGIKKLLQNEKYDKPLIVNNFDDAKHAVNSNKPNIICTALPDLDEAINFCKYALLHSTAVVFLFASAHAADRIADEAESHGIIVIPIPVSKNIFHLALKMTFIAEKRYEILKNENDRLKNQVEEIKLVNRAKLVLIQYLSMSENAAHRYIEKQAMDMRVNKTEIAKQILKMYEN